MQFPPFELPAAVLSTDGPFGGKGKLFLGELSALVILSFYFKTLCSI